MLIKKMNIYLLCRTGYQYNIDLISATNIFVSYVELLHDWHFWHKLRIEVPHMTQLIYDINHKMVNFLF